MVQRITSIDCLRRLAALVVLVWHFQFYFDSRPAASFFTPFYMNGQIAVDTFFVISGFTLTYVYRCRVENFSAFSAYVWRRIARMYPLHLTRKIHSGWQMWCK
jgi:peptidoglycan/LPS O-acetylase OafA/YrhL